MGMKDRLYVASLVVLASVVLSQLGLFQANRPSTGVQVVSVADAQEKNPPKGMEELKKDARAFKRGAIPTPKAKIFAAARFQRHGIQALPNVAYVPKKLDMWGNDQYGDCVSAEEAYNQAVCGKFLDASTVTGWARKNGYLNGADLLEVMQSMNKSGMQQDGHTYGVGGNPVTVDFSNEATLQTALSIGPVKIGIDASALPSGAGNQQGWYTLAKGNWRNEDHCVSLGGYGTADYLFKQLNVPLPAALTPTQTGYLLFTWSTLGFVSHDWIMGTVGEAWLRNPCQIVDNQPTPNPGPVQTVPTITSPTTAAATTGVLFSYQIVATNTPTQYAAAGLPAGVTCAPSTGLITGIPTAAGAFTVTLSATNGSGSGTATLALTVTGAPVPPGPPTPPVPSNVKVVLDPAQILALQRDPTNTFNPTTAQVQQIINDSGLEVIDGKMSLTDFQAAVNRATAKKSIYKAPPKQTITIDDRMERLEKAFMEFMKSQTK